MSGVGERMKVLLVDSNSLFLEELYNLLEANGYEVAGTANNGIEALGKAKLFSPDLVLMDIQIAVSNEFMLIKTIKDDLPAVKVVILAMIENDKLLVKAIRSGAAGYLLKNLKINKFLSLLQKITSG